MIRNKNKLCPICKKNDMVIRIVYGMPTIETFKDSEEGKVRIGGCCQLIEAPKWYCKRDENEF
jgi:hypothetical protein